jgi:hypothetical protein
MAGRAELLAGLCALLTLLAYFKVCSSRSLE